MTLLYRKHKINGCFYLLIFILMTFYNYCQHFGCLHYFGFEEGHLHETILLVKFKATTF